MEGGGNDADRVWLAVRVLLLEFARVSAPVFPHPLSGVTSSASTTQPARRSPTALNLRGPWSFRRTRYYQE